MYKLLIALICVSAYAHEEKLQPVQIIHQGTSNTLVDFAPSVTSLKGDELKKRREITLGDTLRSEVGVQSSSFGPNASRPIIRGLDGDRIRILQNGLGVLDASANGADHAVPVDTLIVDSIEIVRGPMSLLYGSSAVGGVVNINTNRIHSKYEEGAITEFLIQGDSSQDALSTGAKLDYGVDNWMFHFDGGYRNANELRVPKNHKKERVNDLGEWMNTEKLHNTQSVSKAFSLGASKIFEKGFVGVSYYFLDNDYGVIANEMEDHGHGHGHSHENVTIDMKQNRYEMHGEYILGANILKSIRLKTVQSDYKHKEIDGGHVGTTFKNSGNETRLEFMTESGNLKGISGLQANIYDFSADGDEAFLPSATGKTFALFTLQDLTVNKNTFSAGARVETASVDDDSANIKRDFNGISGSLGHRYQIRENLSQYVNFSYTQRIPTFQELYAEGAHIARGIYEVGDDDLKKEESYAVDIGIKHQKDEEKIGFSVYAQKFKNYISLYNTGYEDHDTDHLYMHEYRQVDAVFYGAEFDSKFQLSGPFFVYLNGDYIRGKDDDGDNIPLLSPARTTLGFEYLKDRMSLDIEAQYNFEQSKTAPGEHRTGDFTLLNAGFGLDMVKESGKLSFFARLKNILNQEARLHTSTLKNVAPLAGRHVVAGLQYSY